MEVILSYLENMFLNIPQTPETLRAKEELASMMEDKYNELLAEGKKKNEAIGIVISEFGDLEELTQEMEFNKSGGSASEGREKNMDYEAIGREKADARNGKPPRMVSRQEAEEYIAMSAKTSKWIAIGVMLCIWSPIFLLFWGGVDESVKHMSDFSLTLLGLVPLFIMIGTAVAIFIYNGSKMEKYEYLKKESIRIDKDFELELSKIAEREDPAATIKIIIGVVLCIFSVIPVLLIGSLSDHALYDSIGVVYLLFMVGIAVLLFILGGTKKDCIHVLKQENEFSVGRKKRKKYTEVIGSIYWPAVTVIFLAWSFYTMDWGRSWVIWPVAGVLFGVIAAICEAVSSVEK